MPDRATESPTVRGRRRARQQEWTTQRTVLRLLKRHLPVGCFATALENAPRSGYAGAMAKLRGTRSGLPDWWFVWRGRNVCIELKSRSGVASKTQRQVRDELLAAGVRHWWLARSARAALLALHRSRIPLRNYTPPDKLAAWEGPFADPHARLPQHPAVRAKARIAAAQYRERRREREAAAAGVMPGSTGSAIIELSSRR